MTKTEILGTYIEAFVNEHGAMPTLLALMTVLHAPMAVVMVHLDMLVHKGVLLNDRCSGSPHLIYPGPVGMKVLSLNRSAGAPSAA